MRLWAGDDRHFRLGVVGTLSEIVKFTLYWDLPFSLCSFFLKLARSVDLQENSYYSLRKIEFNNCKKEL